MKQRENVSQTNSESISNNTFVSSNHDDFDDPDNSQFDSDQLTNKMEEVWEEKDCDDSISITQQNKTESENLLILSSVV